MVYDTQNYWVFGLRPSFRILKNTPFRKLRMFPSSGEIREISTLLGPVIEVSSF
jgi:hypothetical protein